ncbi:hypothetical protein [Tenacibaculum litopenaei]|uniref:hypothetical protein n=1 Tax=Tenacibaculum litopenaei TaxID=396016 RepID=UPI0038B51886
MDKTSKVYSTSVRVYYSGGIVSDSNLVQKNNGTINEKKGELKTKMKKIIIIISTFLGVILGVYFLVDRPMVLNTHIKEIVNNYDVNELVFNPIDDVSFSLGKNKAFLFLDKNDLEKLPKGMKKAKMLECKDDKLLNELKESFNFRKTDGDMSTCESKLLIYEGGDLVFKASIVLTDNIIGFQSSLSGWVEATNEKKLKSVFLKFEPSNDLLIKL